MESQGTDMPWARFDDRFPSNRKIRKLSDAAFRLFVSAICWCNENLTDGFVSTDDLPLVSDIRFPNRAADELVQRELWEALPGGWFVHDYFDYNPRAEQVRAAREAKTARQRRWRDASRDAPVDGDVDASTDATRDASHDASEARAHARAYPDPAPIKDSSSPADADDGRTDPEPKPSRKPKPRIVPPRFEEFWAAYPRRVGKISAEKAFAKAIAAGTDPQLIIDAVRLYAMACNTREPQFIKHPATWLNGGCWDDDDPATRPSAPPATTGKCPIHTQPLGRDGTCISCAADAKARRDDDPWPLPGEDAPFREPPF